MTSFHTKRVPWRALGRLCAKIGLILGEILLLTVIVIFCLGSVAANWPSEHVRGWLASGFNETGVFKKGEPFRFVAHLFYTEAELDSYMISADDQPGTVEAVELIPFATASQPTQPGQTVPDGPQPDAWGLVDEDGDGIIVEEIAGQGFHGYMMVVLDPSRVILGSHPENFGARAYAVKDMVESFGGVAGVNAGGFEDAAGAGNGSMPNSIVVYKGEIYCEEKGTGNGFAGFDRNYKLHVGQFSSQEIRRLDIQYGASFGPVLIKDGVVNTEGIKNGFLNPRTAIGQRSDGAVLLLVIEGRKSTSPGATFQDLADIFQNYGAINACNMDGGSSAMMWYDDHYLNSSASLIGLRPIPTAFVVLPKGDTDG
ncbi:MAG: phosphodiester glycosidase family protein [Faecousia sp.]